MEERPTCLVEPYLDQVSGHSCLFQHEGKGVILKPLYPREHRFYEEMPNDMKEFTPAFIGTAKLMVRKQNRDCITFVTCPDYYSNSNIEPNPQESDIENYEPKIRINHSNNEMSITLMNQALPMLEMVRSPEGASHLNKDHVFWNFRLLHKLLLSYHGHPQKFLMLENLTQHMRKPCVMDIKMGTRQHSDEATAQKRLNQIRKCQNTTSSTLGLRVCGMKMYGENSSKVIWCDKYYGRTLKEKDVERLFADFLPKHSQGRQTFISTVWNRLKHIYDVMSEKDNYRFYSTSLLITYDADVFGNAVSTSPCDQGSSEELLKCAEISSSPPIGVHLVDFELVTHRKSKNLDSRKDGPDKGLLFGLRNLLGILDRVATF